jgi:hypothetical protein
MSSVQIERASAVLLMPKASAQLSPIMRVAADVARRKLFIVPEKGVSRLLLTVRNVSYV